MILAGNGSSKDANNAVDERAFSLYRISNSPRELLSRLGATKNFDLRRKKGEEKEFVNQGLNSRVARNAGTLNCAVRVPSPELTRNPKRTNPQVNVRKITSTLDEVKRYGRFCHESGIILQREPVVKKRRNGTCGTQPIGDLIASAGPAHRRLKSPAETGSIAESFGPDLQHWKGSDKSTSQKHGLSDEASPGPVWWICLVSLVTRPELPRAGVIEQTFRDSTNWIALSSSLSQNSVICREG
ncbi:unnamed protein product [Nesidiocoris tenuis]|uniref:Uncharacterized protein n=1 Tax=Nesidiocoris tenuis TaxID=355587 RepID=A0A6H5GN59_9HEMI|nr:unnamed protein product [Nesidiocoris tenuis]